MTLNNNQRLLVIGALDSLGVALADHGHQWTDGERAVYEEALNVLGEKSEEPPSAEAKES